MKSVMFSILIPVYNQELRLDKSLNCILNQTYSDFEVIIVDDKSTDNSLKILTEFSKKDNRIKLYKNLVNRGVGYTRNKLLKKSIGKYIIFIDPDDFVELDLLKNLIGDAKKDIDIIRYQNIVDPVTENQIEIEKNKDLSRFCCKVEKIKSGIEAVRKWDMGLIYINAELWSYCFKRTLFTNNNIKFKNVRVHEDYSVLPMLLLSASSIKVISYIGYHYLQYDNSLTKINSNKNTIIKNLIYKNKIFKKETNRIIKYILKKSLPQSFKDEFIFDLKERVKDQNNKFNIKMNSLKNEIN